MEESPRPQTVYLFPLELLDSKAAKLVRKISDDLATKAAVSFLHSLAFSFSSLLQLAMQQLEDMIADANGLLVSRV